MTISRANRTANHFVTICTQGLNDPRLTWKGKGILAYLLTKPDNWEVRLNHLENVSADGRDGTASGLQELELYGYLERLFLRDPKTGRITGRSSRVNECPDPRFDKRQPIESNAGQAVESEPQNKVIPFGGTSNGRLAQREDEPYSGNSDPITNTEFKLGSNLTKTDLSLNAHAQEPENLKPIESNAGQAVESEPLPPDLGQVAIPVEAIPVEPKAIGEDTFSAALADADFFENWQEFYRKHNRPPWRSESGELHPLLIRAYHATGGSPGGVNIHDLPQGGMNEPKIKKILRRLDNAALYSQYSLKCSATCELQDYWQLAATLDHRPVFVPTKGNLRAMQNSMAIHQAIKDL